MDIWLCTNTFVRLVYVRKILVLPSQISPRTPRRYFMINLKIVSVVAFRLVGMIFTHGLAIVFLRIEYIVSHAYI